MHLGFGAWGLVNLGFRVKGLQRFPKGAWSLGFQVLGSPSSLPRTDPAPCGLQRRGRILGGIFGYFF